MLESRCLPSIFFGRTDGAPDGLVQGQGIIPNVDLELIYWGTPDRWVGASASPDAITAAVTSIYQGPYFDSLGQYSVHKGNDIRVDNITDSNAPDGFTDAQVLREIQILGPAHRVTEAEDEFNRLYFVITPPGSSTAPATEQHDIGDFEDGGEFAEDGNDNGHYAWIANDGNLDHVTRDFSRTLVNAVTNTNNGPTGNIGFLFNPNGNPSGAFELAGDPVADNFTYRLNGVLVQAYWSHNDTAWVVPTGASEAFDFFVTSAGALTVLGYSGPPTANSTTLSTDPQGGVQVVLDVPSFDSGDLHATAQFEPGAVSSVTVLPSQGDTTVNVESIVGGAPATILMGSTGTDTVNISPTRQLLDTIQADVTIHGPQNNDGTTNITQALLASLNVHDEANTRADFYTSTGSDLSRTSTTGAPLGGALHYDGIGNVNISGGSGTYNVQATEDSFTNTPFTTTLTAANNATVNVDQTIGPLVLNLGAGVNTLLLGSTAHRLAGFLAPVTLHAAFNSTILTVDDSFDQRSQPNAVISESSITGLVPAGITYSPRELRSLTVLSGSGGTTFTVSNTPGTPSLAVTTTITSGVGADSIFVQGTTGQLDITGQAGGLQTVTIGNAGSLQGIQGKVALSSTLGTTDLTLDDSADTAARAVSLRGVGSVGEVGGLAPAAIDFDPTQLRSLTIDGGARSGSISDVPNVFNVQDPLPHGTITINGAPNRAQPTPPQNVLSVGLAALANPHLTSTSLTSGQWTFANAGPVNFNNISGIQHDGINSVVDAVFAIRNPPGMAAGQVWEYSRFGPPRLIDAANAVAVSTGVDRFGDPAAFILYNNGVLLEWSANYMSPGSAVPIERLGCRHVNINVAQVSASQQAADTAFIRYTDGEVFEHSGLSAVAGFTSMFVNFNAVDISAAVDANYSPAVYILVPNATSPTRNDLLEWSVSTGLQGPLDTNVRSISAESRADPDGGLTAGFVNTVFIVYFNGLLYQRTQQGITGINNNVQDVSAGATNAGTLESPILHARVFIDYANIGDVYQWAAGQQGPPTQIALGSPAGISVTGLRASEEVDAVFALRSDDQLFEWTPQDSVLGRGALRNIDGNVIGI
jgi:hypothetical protein